MFELRPFAKEHLLPLLEQPGNGYLREWIASGHAEVLADMKSSFTGFVGGVPAVCGGVVELWPDRGYVWTVFNLDFKTNFIPVFRGLKAFLEEFPCRRLEMAVPCDNIRAKARAQLLGFSIEAPLARKYLPNGEDCVLFAKVRA